MVKETSTLDIERNKGDFFIPKLTRMMPAQA